MPQPISKKDYNKLLKACKNLTEFEDYRMDDYISILFNTVLDFQMKTPAVVKADEYYKENNWSKIRTHADLKRVLAKFPNTQKSNTLLANYLWNNNLWTRAELLRQLVKYFESQNVRGYKSLLKWIKKASYEDVKGQIQVRNSKTRRVIHSIGPVLFEWLRLRLGKQTVKADVHVNNFLVKILGYSPNPNKTKSLLIEIAKEMEVEPKKLDAAIWHHMSGY